MQTSHSMGVSMGEQVERAALALMRHNRLAKPTYERKFAELLDLLAATISSLIRRYRLDDVGEDARQAAAIGVHRALQSFDPVKARFGTYVTWQIRGELQGLRHRIRLDQRRSARTSGVSTVPLDALGDGVNEHPVYEIVDEAALSRTERGASDCMALTLIDRLLEQLQTPDHERSIVQSHILDHQGDLVGGSERTREQRRQIVRRTMRNCAKVLAA